MICSFFYAIMLLKEGNMIMKKIVLLILCSFMILGITGCRKEKETKTDNIKDTYNKVENYFGNELVDRSNLGAYSFDEENNIIIVTLIDNSKEQQEIFIKQAEVNSKYIKFEQGGPFTGGPYTGIDFYISKSKIHNDIGFNEYYKNNDRTIYLAGNIDEFYVIESSSKITLKSYISTTFQTFDDSIKSITNQLTFLYSYDDGGTSVYKNQEKDITIIICNTINKNKDIFIGDYKMNFESKSMCK